MSLNICVCTLICDSAVEYGRYSAAINKIYCDRHGYTFVVEYNKLDQALHPYWNKLLLMQRELNNGYDYVMYIDADAVFTNMSTRIEDFIVDSSIYIANENLAVSDSFGENSGVILIKNDDISRSFLADAINRYDECKNSCTPEQLAIALEVEGTYREHTTQYPCVWFNAYAGPFAEGLNRPWCLWRDGCYIKHMLMSPEDIRIQEFRKILKDISNE